MAILVVSILSAVPLFGLWWLYFVEYRAYRQDLTRQQLFNIRDELFLKAENRVLSFRDPAYVLMRQTINGMIRFTHEMRLIQVVALAFSGTAARARGVQFTQTFESAMGQLSLEGRGAIRHAQRNMHTVVLKHVLLDCIVTAIPYVALWLMFRLLPRFWDKLTLKAVNGESTRSRWSALDAEAKSIASRGDPILLLAN